MLDADTSLSDPNHTLKILVASDVHLGYNEKDPVRGSDSFNSFEEALQIAKERNVDFVLLGGDLFDANKPTQYCMQRAVDTIKKWSFGDRPINFQVMGSFENCDGELSEILQNRLPNINFCDPNLNVAIPIFSIHGNHDDPCGMKSISSLDTLSTMGLVNYIGRWDKVEHLEISPIVLKKGDTALALYGVGYMADKRLARLFRENKVTIHAVNQDSAFQLMVLHQNRAYRGNLNYISYTCIPSFMDLVIWGHEHDCYIDPEPQNNVYYSQPGSTVATSLIEGESLTKHVGILYINKKSFHMEPIKLKTVRPLVHRHLILDTPAELLKKGVAEADLEGNTERAVMAEIEDILRQLQEERTRDLAEHRHVNDMLPLVRVVANYVDGRQCFNDKKFTFLLDGKVANPGDVVLQKRTGGHRRVVKGLADLPDADDDHYMDVNSFVNKELEENLTENLTVCTVSGLIETLTRFVDFGDSAAFDDYFSYRREAFLSTMEQQILYDDDDNEIDRKIDAYIASNAKVDEAEAVHVLLTDPARKRRNPRNRADVDIGNADDGGDDTTVDNSVNTATDNSVRGPGPGRTQNGAPRQPSTRRRKKAT